MAVGRRNENREVDTEGKLFFQKLLIFSINSLEESGVGTGHSQMGGHSTVSVPGLVDLVTTKYQVRPFSESVSWMLWVDGWLDGLRSAGESLHPLGLGGCLCPDQMDELPTGESTRTCSRMCISERVKGRH